MRLGGIDQRPWPYWKNVQWNGKFVEDQGHDVDLLLKRNEETFAEMTRQLSYQLYADDEPTPFSHPARWQRFMNWLGDNRVTNAWLVLIGREDIDRVVPLMADIVTAAHSLILMLNAPAQAHSVWIRTETDPETKEFVRSLCVSIRPSWKAKIKVPQQHDGHTVVNVPWPKGS